MPYLSTKSDMFALIARCMATYGERRGGIVSPDQLAAEWLKVLGPFPPVKLHRALDVHFQCSQWWPTPAELLQGVRALIPPPQMQAFREERLPDLTPDEIKRRVEVVKRIKANYGWHDKPKDPMAHIDEWKPASQEGISDDLRRLLERQRALHG